MKVAFLAIFALGFAAANAEHVSYEGYKVFRLIPRTQAQVDFLRTLQAHQLDFWKECSKPNRSCDLLLSPVQQEQFLPGIYSAGVDVKEFVSDVASLSGVGTHQGTGKITWDFYYSVDDIYDFLHEQAALHSQIADVFSIGQSFEGRELNVIHISKTPGKPVIFIEANAHAREWITNAVATYLINELLNSEDPEVQSWTEDFDWYVLPVFNPDGYEYSRSTDRMWRKNRRDGAPACKGVDLNRNFDYNWCGAGASPDPCSMTYCGSAVQSEPETQAVVNFVQMVSNRTNNLAFYLSVHSYSQFIMFPYADRIDDSIYDSHMAIASATADSLAERHGTVFIPGNWREILYISTGDSMDWAKSKANASLSFTYELRDTGRYGFLLPPDQILDSADEFVHSLRPIINALRAGIP